jgi:hypothetical protein
VPRPASRRHRGDAPGGIEAEIAAITGLLLRQVRSILNPNYLHRDLAPAKSAVSALEKSTKSARRFVDVLAGNAKIAGAAIGRPACTGS